MKIEEVIIPAEVDDPGDENNFTVWSSDQYGEMKSFKACATATGLEKYDHIKEKAEKIYLEKWDYEEKTERPRIGIDLEIAFDSENVLREIVMFVRCQSEDYKPYDDWTDPEIIGEEITDQDGNIVGHTMLSEEEFSYLIDMATKAVHEIYPNKEDQEKT